MTRNRPNAAILAVLLGFAVCLPVTVSAGQAQALPPRQPAAAMRPAAAAPPAPVRTVTEARNAEETKQELNQLLDRYSPSLAGVLKLDPSLLADPDYLSPYPGLAEFLAQHPEVARDPAYFFEDVQIVPRWRLPESPRDPQERVIGAWKDMMAAVLVFIGFLFVISTLIWLIKTLIDYRRWGRLSKVQAEVHNKVLDRFANNEDLLAYVQTPAGRRFLESAPIMLDPAGPAVAAPLRRILWAVEAGFVLMAGGVGLQFVSGRVPAEISPMLFAVGVLGLALGLGFLAAALASFVVSRRLGLVPPPSARAGDRAEG